MAPSLGSPSAPLPPAADMTIVLLYGPVVQFAQPAANQPAASIVAMPPQLPLSVDPVFVHPPSATLPDSLAHFCFAPVLKLQEPSELSFCLTDSSGCERYGVSLQVLCAHGSSQAKHRPIALVMLAGRPLYAGISRLLHLLLPLVLQAQKQPTKKEASTLKLRCGRDKYGMGLVMSTNNTVMTVEAGGVAARERRLRPGDLITALDGEPLGGVRLSEALRLQGEAEAASGAPPAPQSGAPPGGAVHMLTVTRHKEVLPPGSAHAEAIARACAAALALLCRREQDLKWLVANPFWLPAPLEPLFARLNYNVPEVAYLLAGLLTDQKVLLRGAQIPTPHFPCPPHHTSLGDTWQVLLVGSDPTVLLPCAEAYAPYGPRSSASHHAPSWPKCSSRSLLSKPHRRASLTHRTPSLSHTSRTEPLSHFAHRASLTHLTCDRLSGEQPPRTPLSIGLLVALHPVPARHPHVRLRRPYPHVRLHIAIVRSATSHPPEQAHHPTRPCVAAPRQYAPVPCAEARLHVL